MDFANRANREIVIKALGGADEFRASDQRKLLAGPGRVIDRLPIENTPGLYWDRRPVLAEGWFTEGNRLSVNEEYTPLLLWLAERKSLYAFPGMGWSGPVSDNTLTANPEWSIWGPKITLKAGHYRVRVDLEGDSGDLFQLDIATEFGNQSTGKDRIFWIAAVDMPNASDI